MNCDLWLNGAHIGSHVYGYTSFWVDITDTVKQTGNELLVRVDNARQPNSRWYTGSGITRDVCLCKTQSLCVAPWGVYVHTPAITADRAEVCVETQVLGGGPEVRLETELWDAEGGKRVAADQCGTPGGGWRGAPANAGRCLASAAVGYRFPGAVHGQNHGLSGQ